MNNEYIDELEKAVKDGLIEIYEIDKNQLATYVSIIEKRVYENTLKERQASEAAINIEQDRPDFDEAFKTTMPECYEQHLKNDSDATSQYHACWIMWQARTKLQRECQASESIAYIKKLEGAIKIANDYDSVVMDNYVAKLFERTLASRPANLDRILGGE